MEKCYVDDLKFDEINEVISNVENAILDKEKELCELKNKLSNLYLKLEVLRKEDYLNKSLEIAYNQRDIAIELLGGKENVFEYGGLCFIPFNYSFTPDDFDILFTYRNDIMSGYGLTSNHSLYEDYCHNKLCTYYSDYTKDGFYEKSTLKNVNLFYCIDNGRFYMVNDMELLLVINDVLNKFPFWDMIEKISGANTF